jgi:hypothetical protein
MDRFFKSKEERKQEDKERQERLLKEFIETRNLENLSESDKEFLDLIRENVEDITRYSVKGSDVEIRQLEMMNVIAEQNWLIIKLLNDINKELDR